MKTKATVKHTPGPWTIQADWLAGWSIAGSAGEYRKVATVRAEGRPFANPPQDPEALANARLIAAAPDLYEALTRLEDHACDFMAQPDNKDYAASLWEAVHAARAALSKSLPSGAPQDG